MEDKKRNWTTISFNEKELEDITMLMCKYGFKQRSTFLKWVVFRYLRAEHRGEVT